MYFFTFRAEEFINTTLVEQKWVYQMENPFHMINNNKN